MPTGYKVLLLCLIVVIPGLCVGISNFNVFPDTWLLVTLILVTTVGVACAFTGLASRATRKVLRYCVVADVIIAGVLVANLAAHLVLTREISAANQDVSERRAEDAIQDKREDERMQREIMRANAKAKFAESQARLADSQAKLQNAEAVRLARLPRSQRRSALAASSSIEWQEPTAQIEPGEKPDAIERVKVAIRTPTEIRAAWWPLLIALAIAECVASVLAGAILMAAWEWDKNGNGIADHLEGVVGHAVEAEVTRTLDRMRQGAYRPQMQTVAERTFRILPDGRREIVHSTVPGEIGAIWPDEIDATDKPGKLPPSW